MIEEENKTEEFCSGCKKQPARLPANETQVVALGAVRVEIAIKTIGEKPAKYCAGCFALTAETALGLISQRK